MLDKRKEQILKIILKEHIKTGAPVGSGVLVDKYKLKISPATVRNEMAELEERGYIKQPYTSAGRIPTEKAFRFYIENITEKKLDGSETEEIKSMLKKKNELGYKQAAKTIAKMSESAVFWAFHKHDLYYTGISNLLAQPEFAQNGLIYDISGIIDRMDEIIEKNFDKLGFGVQIMLGSENPFSRYCGAITAKYKVEGQIGLFGILGPMRMNYEKNAALVKYLTEEITKLFK